MTKITSQEIMVLSAKDFARGMATARDSQDGLFSPELPAGINLTANPGVLYGQQPGTDMSPTTSGVFAAVCKGGGSDADLGFKNNYGITETGKFYSFNGTTWTNDVTDGSKTYIIPTTDIIFYKEYIYCTSTDNITRGTMPASTGGVGYNITSINNTWGSTTLGIGGLSTIDRHPMIIFEDILWIGDQNKLHKWDGTTATASALVMGSDQNITALGIDPSSGRMMIATTQGANASGATPRVNKISFWDGTSSKVLRAVEVDEMVTAFQIVGGTVYIVYGTNLGYWNGSGISWLRSLSKVTFASARLPYKHKMTCVGNTLFVTDNTMVLAYGSVLAGYPKVFYYVAGGTTGTLPITYINCIQNVGGNNLGIFYTDGASANYIIKFPTKTISTGNGVSSYQNIYLSYITFKKKIRVKMIKLAFKEAVTTGKSPWAIICYGSDPNNYTYFKNSNPSTGDVYEIEYFPTSGTMLELDDLSLRLINGDTSDYTVGIRKITIYYDFVE